MYRNKEMITKRILLLHKSEARAPSLKNGSRLTYTGREKSEEACSRNGLRKTPFPYIMASNTFRVFWRTRLIGTTSVGRGCHHPLLSWCPISTAESLLMKKNSCLR